MKPQTIGRVLGIGMRVAGRMAGQRLAGGGQPAPNSAGNRQLPADTIDAVTPRPTAGVPRTAGRATGSVARGLGGFLRPFRRVGNIVFLEVVGAFFFLFVIAVRNARLAAESPGRSGAGTCQVPGLRGHDAAVSIFQRQFLLAGETEVAQRISFPFWS